MESYELFERMVKAKELYDKLDKEQDQSFTLKEKIYKECQNVENKFFNCITNTELNRILTTNMTANERKLKCYNEIVGSEKIFIENRKWCDDAYSEYYKLKKRVYNL
jgi:hypothetical protein